MQLFGPKQQQQHFSFLLYLWRIFFLPEIRQVAARRSIIRTMMDGWFVAKLLGQKAPKKTERKTVEVPDPYRTNLKNVWLLRKTGERRKDPTIRFFCAAPVAASCFWNGEDAQTAVGCN